ncbi:MAG: radical SAM protein, partial [Thermoplasmata archaeon]
MAGGKGQKSSPINMQEIRVYQIWPVCPSISISGLKCYLNCSHCMGKYLRYMHGVHTKTELRNLCERLIKKGARGFLISGGCDKNGKMLNLEEMLGEIQKMHEKGIVIKLHTGFVDERTASLLTHSIDVASMEFPASFAAIKEIFNLNATPETYIETFRNLRNANVYIAPHICIGLYHGKLTDEFKALDMLGTIFQPETLVFIAYIPTSGTPSENDPLPSPADVKKVIEYARKKFPDTHIVLGALRPRFAKIRGLTREYVSELEMRAIEG